LASGQHLIYDSNETENKHMAQIVRCLSCDGYGWQADDLTGQTDDCAWCGGAGYMYALENGVQQRIPTADYAAVADELERLEQERLREMGYTGQAKPPWEQDIRRGTRGGLPPDERDS